MTKQLNGGGEKERMTKMKCSIRYCISSDRRSLAFATFCLNAAEQVAVAAN